MQTECRSKSWLKATHASLFSDPLHAYKRVPLIPLGSKQRSLISASGMKRKKKEEEPQQEPKRPRRTTWSHKNKKIKYKKTKKDKERSDLEIEVDNKTSTWNRFPASTDWESENCLTLTGQSQSVGSLALLISSIDLAINTKLSLLTTSSFLVLRSPSVSQIHDNPLI